MSDDFVNEWRAITSADDIAPYTPSTSPILVRLNTGQELEMVAGQARAMAAYNTVIAWKYTDASVRRMIENARWAQWNPRPWKRTEPEPPKRSNTGTIPKRSNTGTILTGVLWFIAIILAASLLQYFSDRFPLCP